MRAALALILLAVGTLATARPVPNPATLLVGQSWLGRWQGGKLVAQADEPAWQFNSIRRSPDGKAIEVAAYPADRDLAIDAASVRVLRFDPLTLRRIGERTDPTAAQWQPVPAPVGIAQARIKSPDGALIAIFARPRRHGAPWVGRVRDLRNGRTIAAQGLSIDQGLTRDPPVNRSIACLLPQGEGAIMTYLGAPADGYSEYLPFKHGRKAVELQTPYVKSCLVG